jgi:hypothetical protein
VCFSKLAGTSTGDSHKQCPLYGRRIWKTYSSVRARWCKRDLVTKTDAPSLIGRIDSGHDKASIIVPRKTVVSRPRRIGQSEFYKLSAEPYLAENKHKTEFMSAREFRVQDYGQIRALARLEHQWLVRILPL